MDISCSSLIFYLAVSNQWPHLYFAFVLVFLIPFSCFIAFQLFKLINAEICFYKLRRDDALLCNSNEILRLSYVMLRKKLFFDAIQLIESKQSCNDIRIYQLMNALGFIYYSIHQYRLAKFYYIEALKIKNDYIVALQNIAKVYDLTKESCLLKLACESILKYDPENKIARQYLAN